MALFLRQSSDGTAIEKLLYRISTYFLQIILDIFGMGIFTGVVYQWLYDMVDFVLRGFRVSYIGDAENAKVSAILAIFATEYPQQYVDTAVAYGLMEGPTYA